MKALLLYGGLCGKKTFSIVGGGLFFDISKTF